VIIAVIVGVWCGSSGGAQAAARQGVLVGTAYGITFGALIGITVAWVPWNGWRSVFPGAWAGGVSRGEARRAWRALRRGDAPEDRRSAAALVSLAEFQRSRLIPCWALRAYAIVAGLYAALAASLLVAALAGVTGHLGRHALTASLSGAIAVVAWRRPRHRDSRRRAAEDAARRLLDAPAS
jgi:hypothetical protein